MGQRHAQKWCKACESNVMAVKATPNHVLHLLLSLVTAGVWIIGWIAAKLASDWRGYACTRCGGDTRSARRR